VALFQLKGKFRMINTAPNKKRCNRSYHRLLSLGKCGIDRVPKVFSFCLVSLFSRAGLSPITELFKQPS